MLQTIAYLFAFSITFNLLMYAFAYLFQTDKITDLSYSLTFGAIAIAGFVWLKNDAFDLWMVGLILIWAIRLGGYLFWRIHKMGRDDRFDHIRSNPISFLGFWIMQGLTCAILSIPVLLFFKAQNDALSLLNWVGVCFALFGLALETIADFQKSNFKQKHPNQFIQSGLWKIIRHPNYTGELLFWIGVSLLAWSTSYWYLALLSPLWIAFILIGFSGIPPLEKKWKVRLAQDSKFRAYWEKSWRLIPYVY